MNQNFDTKLSCIIFVTYQELTLSSRIMVDFNYYAPTEVVFGKNSEEQLAKLVKHYGGTKVLVHYGGNSAKRSGLLNKLHKAVSRCYMPKILRISTKWQENKKS